MLRSCHMQCDPGPAPIVTSAVAGTRDETEFEGQVEQEQHRVQAAVRRLTSIILDNSAFQFG